MTNKKKRITPVTRVNTNAESQFTIIIAILLTNVKSTLTMMKMKITRKKQILTVFIVPALCRLLGVYLNGIPFNRLVFVF